MNKRRLLKLADIVEKSVENSRGKKGFQFDMHTWGESVTTSMSLDCGTSACMLGTAAISGAFKRAGLSFKVEPDSSDNGNIVFRLYGVKSEWWEAASEIFDLTHDETQFLFLPGTYPFNAPYKGKRGARYAAKRVRDFVKHGGVF